MAFATCKLLTQGTTLTQGEDGYVYEFLYRIEGIDEDDDFISLSPGISYLDFALNLPDRGGREAIGQRGDIDTFYTTINPVDLTKSATTQLCLVSKTGRHPTSARGIVEVKTRWTELGIPVDKDGDFVTPGSDRVIAAWFVGAAVNGTTVATQTSFQWVKETDGPNYGLYTPHHLLQVYYKAATANYDHTTDTNLAPNIAAGIVKTQYARMPSLEGLTTLQFRMREFQFSNVSEDDPNPPIGIPAKMAAYNGTMNETEIWGYPPFTLRLRTTVAEVDALRSVRINNPGDSADSNPSDPTGVAAVPPL
jgi:hypothetical protein